MTWRSVRSQVGIVGERGETLSHGQRQRVAIARALLVNLAQRRIEVELVNPPETLPKLSPDAHVALLRLAWIGSSSALSRSSHTHAAPPSSPSCARVAATAGAIGSTSSPFRALSEHGDRHLAAIVAPGVGAVG